jgi:hypothetical protein
MMRPQRYFPNGTDIVFPKVASEPLYYGRQQAIPFEGHRAIIDEETGEVLTVVSDQYNLIRHENIIETIETQLRKMNVVFERNVTMIKAGARMVATYTLPEIQVVLASDEVLIPTMVIKNSYDLSWVASMMGGVMRLICTNGAYMGTMFKKMRHRHVGILDEGYLKERLSALGESFDLYVQNYKSMLVTPLSPSLLGRLTAFGFNVGETTALRTMREQTSGLTLDLAQHTDPATGEEVYVWEAKDMDKFHQVDLFNLTTEFTTHKVASAVRQDMFYDRISRSLMEQ